MFYTIIFVINNFWKSIRIPASWEVDGSTAVEVLLAETAPVE